MTRKQKRLAVIAGGMSFIIAAVLLVMFAFSQSVAYFYMPADLASNPIAPGTRIRPRKIPWEISHRRRPTIHHTGQSCRRSGRPPGACRPGCGWGR